MSGRTASFLGRNEFRFPAVSCLPMEFELKDRIPPQFPDLGTLHRKVQNRLSLKLCGNKLALWTRKRLLLSTLLKPPIKQTILLICNLTFPVSLLEKSANNLLSRQNNCRTLEKFIKYPRGAILEVELLLSCADRGKK